MRVIARIPDASAPADGPRPEVRPESVPTGRAGTVAAVARPKPTWPVAVLAVAAVLAWVLASWSEHVRLHRQRDEMRVAREPEASSGASRPGPAAGGAVVR